MKYHVKYFFIVHFNKNKKYIDKNLFKKGCVRAKKMSLLACPKRNQAPVLRFN